MIPTEEQIKELEARIRKLEERIGILERQKLCEPYQLRPVIGKPLSPNWIPDVEE